MPRPSRCSRRSAGLAGLNAFDLVAEAENLDSADLTAFYDVLAGLVDPTALASLNDAITLLEGITRTADEDLLLAMASAAHLVGSVLLAADPDGDVVVAGTFGSSFSFDGHPVTMNGASQGFVCTLSSPNGGSVLDAKDYGGVNEDGVDWLMIDNGTKHQYAMGHFQSITMLGDKVLTATGTDASFVARIVTGRR